MMLFPAEEEEEALVFKLSEGDHTHINLDNLVALSLPELSLVDEAGEPLTGHISLVLEHLT